MSEKGQIVSWIDSRIRKAPVEIDLSHHRGDKVESFELEENESTEELVNRIFKAAEEDAHGMYGPQGYWIILRLAGTRDVLSRKSISVDGEMHEKGRGSESPDEWGLTAQAMRHMEGVLKMTLNAINQSALNSQRENERMSAQLTELSRVEIERMAMSRQLAQDVANQRVEEQKVLAQAARDKWLMRQIEMILPVGVSKLFGAAEGDGPNWAQEADILIRLSGTLSPEQMSKVFLIFDPPSRLLLGSLAKGEVSQSFAPLAVQRLMQGLTQDQFIAIFRLLETEEQKGLFQALFAVRKHGIEWSENEALESQSQSLRDQSSHDQPRYLPPNGVNGAVAPEGKTES